MTTYISHCAAQHSHSHNRQELLCPVERQEYHLREVSQSINRRAGFKFEHVLNHYFNFYLKERRSRRARGENWIRTWDGSEQAGDAFVKTEQSFRSLDFLERGRQAKEAVGGGGGRLVVPARQPPQKETGETCSPDSGCSSLQKEGSSWQHLSC